MEGRRSCQNESRVGASSYLVICKHWKPMLVYGLETLVRFGGIAEEKCLNIFLILMPVTRTKLLEKGTLWP